MKWQEIDVFIFHYVHAHSTFAILCEPFFHYSFSCHRWSSEVVDLSIFYFFQTFLQFLIYFFPLFSFFIAYAHFFCPFFSCYMKVHLEFFYNSNSCWSLESSFKFFSNSINFYFSWPKWIFYDSLIIFTFHLCHFRSEWVFINILRFLTVSLMWIWCVCNLFGVTLLVKSCESLNKYYFTSKKTSVSAFSAVIKWEMPIIILMWSI